MGTGSSVDDKGHAPDAESRREETPSKKTSSSPPPQPHQSPQQQPQPQPSQPQQPASSKRMQELGLVDSDDDEQPSGSTSLTEKHTKKVSVSFAVDESHSAPALPEKKPKRKVTRKHVQETAAAPIPKEKLFKGSEPGPWQKGNLIGKGATGQVFQAVDELSDTIFCVKEVQFSEDVADNPDELARFNALKAEVALLQEINHPNVVRFLGISKVGFSMFIMMEYVTGGNIQSIVNEFGALSDETAAKYTKQLVEGLCYLHEKNIIHRDIKGANLLVGVDGVLKLADFGAAKRILEPEQMFKTLAGTPYWMAPEVVRQEGHNKAADVWSVGATVLQMVTGLAPYQSLPPVPALFKIGHGTDVPVPADVSPLVKDFIRLCLARDASKRPTVQQLKEHPWLAAVNARDPSISMEISLAYQEDPGFVCVHTSTQQALARRELLQRRNEAEEDEIMEFILHMATTESAPYDFDDDEDTPQHNPKKKEEEPLDLDAFDETKFDEFVSNLEESTKDQK